MCSIGYQSYRKDDEKPPRSTAEVIEEAVLKTARTKQPSTILLSFCAIFESATIRNEFGSVQIILKKRKEK